MTINESCVDGLSRAGMLAGALDPNRSPKLNLQAPNINSGLAFDGFDKALKKNGVSGLLAMLPFGRGELAELGWAAAVVGLLATIMNTLHVNLLAPGAVSSLKQKLQRVCGGGTFIQSVPQLPQIHASSLPRLTQLGTASLALKGVGVNLFSANGAKDLQRLLSSPSTSRMLSELSSLHIPMSTLNGLTKLANFSQTNQALRVLGPSLSAAFNAPHNAPVLHQLRNGQLAELWPGIAAGNVGPQIRLPNPGQVASLNAQKAAVKLLSRATGLNSQDPGFSTKLSGVLDSLGTCGACGVVNSNPIRGSQLEGLNRLASCQSSMETIQTGLSIDLMAKDAGTKLARQINVLRAHKQIPASGENWSEVLGALARLAHLGTAIT
jgi:hypothetical protein